MKPSILLTAIATIWTIAVVHSTGQSQQTSQAQQGQPVSKTSGPRSVWDGVYTDEQAKRGESIYKNECVACHGPSLEGNGEGANPLTGPAFFAIWNGLTLADLFDRMRLSMPQNAPGKLTRQQNADVLAYVLSVNKFPPGKAPLATESERLREIKFDAIKQDAAR